MAEHRDRFFLATKTGERTGPGARAELERSLERLRVDQVDLIQLHNLVEPDEWEVAHGPGGAVEALAQARDEGLVRFVGVTGHGTRIARMHLRSLERHPFDSVLLPYSYAPLADPAYRADVEELLGVCADRGRGGADDQGASARRRWPEDHEGRRFSWYQPLADAGPSTAPCAGCSATPQLVPQHHQRRPAAAGRPGGGRGRGRRPAARPTPRWPPTSSGSASAPLFDGEALERI